MRKILIGLLTVGAGVVLVASADKPSSTGGGNKPPVVEQGPPGRARAGFTGNGSASEVRLYLFGGMNYTSGRNGPLLTYPRDLWYYTPEGTTRWHKVTSSSTKSPGGRTFPGWSCGDGACVLNGGFGSIAGFPDTWIYSETSSAWSKVDCRRTACPPGRYTPAQAYDPDNNTHVMFGGMSGVDGSSHVRLGDTYTFENGIWVAQEPETSPPARGYAAAAFVPGKGVVIFGGIGSAPPVLGDMWVWDGTTWSNVTYQNTGPALTRATAAWTSKGLLIANGYKANDSLNTNSWYFNFDTGVWTEVAGRGGCVSVGGSDLTVHPEANMAFDGVSQAFFGGYENSMTYGNTVECSLP